MTQTLGMAVATRACAPSVVVVTLPLPPSLNNIFFNRRVKGRAKTTEYKNWLDSAGWSIRAQRVPLISGAVKVDAIIERPNKASDLDNRMKPLLDALQSFGVIENDNKVEALSFRWGNVVGAVVTVRAA